MSEPRARILYIDDDDGLRRLAERALTRRGFEVTLASRGSEGIALAAAQRFDLITVDHYMPEMDGLETLKRLRQLPTAPPIVYVTGSEEGRIAIAALKAGAVDYVVKQVGDDFFDLLARAFDNELERVALQRANEAAEWELRASHTRLEVLLREVNHRVANSLQLVSAFVQLQSSALADKEAKAALKDTQRRIAAVGQVHRRLYTTNDVEGVDMADYLGGLCEELGQSWAGARGGITVKLDADAVRLPTDRAVSVGVIVTELVTNACKYAYPEGNGGEVRVSLKTIEDEKFELCVADDGVGIGIDTKVKGTGLGTKVINAMAHGLRSTVDIDATQGGLRASLVASQH